MVFYDCMFRINWDWRPYHIRMRAIDVNYRDSEHILTDDEDDQDFVDGRGLSASQLVRKVANTKPPWGKMDIIDPDVLEHVFSFEDVDVEEEENIFDYSEQTIEVYDFKGRGRHRSYFNFMHVK